jgi:hypothetical protein
MVRDANRTNNLFGIVRQTEIIVISFQDGGREKNYITVKRENKRI